MSADSAPFASESDTDSDTPTPYRAQEAPPELTEQEKQEIAKRRDDHNKKEMRLKENK